MYEVPLSSLGGIAPARILTCIEGSNKTGTSKVASLAFLI